MKNIHLNRSIRKQTTDIRCLVVIALISYYCVCTKCGRIVCLYVSGAACVWDEASETHTEEVSKGGWVKKFL